MKIISANLNGIRSAQNKGFFDWLVSTDADIICLQELKADLSVIPAELLNFNGYHCEFHPAQKKGYSGVAIMARNKPDEVIVGLNNPEIDDEGRYLEFRYGSLSVISLYLPSGSSGEDKQAKKFRFMEYYLPILQRQHHEREYIICGDWNIAHQEIDLKNWKGNLKNSGFLPEERQWIGSLFKDRYIDAWRHLYPEEPGYTWWSNRGQAYAKNVGWRIDYQLISRTLVDKLRNAAIYKEQKFSDHAPLIMEYDFTI
jgi:exodeoxyribonuclease-3